MPVLDSLHEKCVFCGIAYLTCGQTEVPEGILQKDREKQKLLQEELQKQILKNQEQLKDLQLNNQETV